jgi:hypothetical protein
LDSLISDQILLKENSMEEKKTLSIEEIEAQCLVELPDRAQMDILTTIVLLLFNLGGGGGGEAGGGIIVGGNAGNTF